MPTTTWVALAAAYPTEADARQSIAEQAPGEPAAPYRGIWHAPTPESPRVHLFTAETEEHLVSTGWLLSGIQAPT